MIDGGLFFVLNFLCRTCNFSFRFTNFAFLSSSSLVQVFTMDFLILAVLKRVFSDGHLYANCNDV